MHHNDPSSSNMRHACQMATNVHWIGPMPPVTQLPFHPRRIASKEASHRTMCVVYQNANFSHFGNSQFGQLDVQSTSDVQKTLAFVKSAGITLVIKNTGVCCHYSLSGHFKLNHDTCSMILKDAALLLTLWPSGYVLDFRSITFKPNLRPSVA